MSSTEVQYIRALNGKLIPRESRDPTASASAWAVKWKLPSEGSRIPLVNEEGGCSPGPKYYPKLQHLGLGPSGKGAEYSLRPSHRFPITEKKTKTDEWPGPKYMVPGGNGKQFISTMRSYNGGKISNSERKTKCSDFQEVDSPGPAYYNPPPAGSDRAAVKSKRLNGFGGAQRMYRSKLDFRPGPGDYKLPPSIGGNHPWYKSAPVYSAPKGERSGTKHLAVPGRDPPGPGADYAIRASVGDQVLSRFRSAGKPPFSMAKRFPEDSGQGANNAD